MVVPCGGWDPWEPYGGDGGFEPCGDWDPWEPCSGGGFEPCGGWDPWEPCGGDFEPCNCDGAECIITKTVDKTKSTDNI